MKPERLLFIDGLRGIAAVSVVLYHLCQRSPLAAWTSRGGLGVIVFFVLSGLVIAMVIGRAEITAGYAGRFALRRSLRLDPPYWASMFVVIGLAIAAGHMGETRALPGPGQIAAHLTYTQDLLGYTPLSEVYWTLCLEIQFYLTMLAILWLTRQRMTAGPYMLWIGLYVISLCEYTWTDFSPRGLCLPYWWAFALGTTLAWVIARRLDAYVVGVMAALALPFLAGKHPDGLAAGLLTTGALWLAIYRQAMGSWLRGPAWQFAGRVSYSLYLIHPLIGWTVQSLALRYVDAWTALAAGLIASVLSAWIMYWVVERPAVRLSRLVGTVPRVVATQHGGLRDVTD